MTPIRCLPGLSAKTPLAAAIRYRQWCRPRLDDEWVYWNGPRPREGSVRRRLIERGPKAAPNRNSGVRRLLCVAGAARGEWRGQHR